MLLASKNEQVVARRVLWARTPFAQLRGLIRRSIGADDALLLPRCPQVHTAFLAFPIDVAFCSGSEQQGYSLLAVQTLKPWTASRFVPGATLAIEMRAGSPLPALEAGCVLTLR